MRTRGAYVWHMCTLALLTSCARHPSVAHPRLGVFSYNGAIGVAPRALAPYTPLPRHYPGWRT